MRTIQDRLAMFLADLNISTQKFERQCDMGQGAAAKLTAKSYATTYAKIAKAFPQLNVDWLKTGNGEMLKSSQSRHVRDINGNSNFLLNDHSINIKELKVQIEDELANDSDMSSSIETLQNEVKTLRQLLSEAEKEIARLEGKVEQQNETIILLIGK